VLAHVILWASLVYVGVVVGILASRVSILGASARVVGKLPLVGRRLRIDPAKVGEMERAVRSALTERPTALAYILLLEISAQAVLVCEMYWAIRSMGVAVSLPSALFFEVMTRALTVVEFVGATEVGFAVVFTWLGMPAAIGFTLSLIKTLRSLTAGGIGVGIGVFTGGSCSNAASSPTRPPVKTVLDSAG